ncbi:TonB-dependent receptor, partial [Parabacteroides distasonis]|uniref:outer membrane beta-barrel protein n=2 Tax=Tannerellaceae TaxID=2005525 RepID=UPI0039B51D7A
MRKLFLSLVFLSALLSIHANPGIKGIVIDQTTRKALDYAHVVLYDGDHIVEEAMTEANGSFLIQPVKPGTYSIRIHFLGYDVYMGEEFILTEQIKDLGIIPMQMLEVGLQEVEVVANKKQVIYKLDKKIIEASSNLLSSGGTAVDILENTPSIRVNAEGEVTFRGSSGFTVYVDGKPSIFTGTQALEQIPSGQIQNIEIITTPSAQHDTGGDVGIINVITKKNFGEGLSGVINLSGNTVWSRTLDFLLTGQNKASQWRIGGYVGNRLRKSHFTQEKTTLVNDTTTTSYSNGPRESNGYAYILNGGWSYTQKQTTFSINAEGGYAGLKRKGDLEYTEERSANGEQFENGEFKSLDDFDIHETFGLGNLAVDHKFNDKGHNLSGSFFLKYGGDALEYFQSDLFDKNNVRQQGHRAWEAEHRWTVRAKADYVFPYSKTGQIKAGYQYFSYSEDGDYSMQFWNPDTKEFFWRDDIYNTFYFQQGINSLYAIVG